MDIALFLSTALLALVVLLRRRDARSLAIASACGLVAVASFLVRDFDGDPDLRAALPQETRHDGFVSSAACRSCHPSEHASWRGSYHRSMTQAVSETTVLGDFDDVVLEDRGQRCRLFRRKGEFWVDMVDPLWFEATPGVARPAPTRIEVRVVMATGSHHLQTYWARRPSNPDTYRRPDRGELYQLQFSWLVDEGRWVPTQDTFLAPPSKAHTLQLPWNSSCNMCHSVATRPGLSETGFATESVELGIACEACHGPGEAHVRWMQSPLRRYAAHFSDDDAVSSRIVNPAKLDKDRSAEVCGQCHSFNKELDMTRWAKDGVAYRAGDELGETKAVFGYTQQPAHPRLLEHLKEEPDALQGRFWRDGTMRVAGREYNGLIVSKCYTHGEMTCLSCHSMHDYDRAKDQLSRAHQGDESCQQCHDDLVSETAIVAHSHHAIDSEGSRCVNCHMPHTTYGLLVAMRSHRIDSPTASMTAKHGRPNACNLCHLDRTLQWTAEKLTSWYGQPQVALTEDQRKIAAAVLWATTGDAAQRAVATWAMGWAPGHTAAGRQWKGAYLANALGDPYAVIRQVAYNSLRQLGGYEDLDYDYVAPRAQIDKNTVRALRRWQKITAGSPDRSGPQLLLDPQGKLNVDELERLVRTRDNTPVRIIE